MLDFFSHGFRFLSIYLFWIDWIASQPVSFPLLLVSAMVGGWDPLQWGCLWAKWVVGPECANSEGGSVRWVWEVRKLIKLNFKPPPPANVWALKVDFPLSMVTWATWSGLSSVHIFLLSVMFAWFFFFPPCSVIVKYLFLYCWQECFLHCVLSPKRKVTLGSIKEMGQWWLESFHMAQFSLWHLTGIKR